MTIRSVARFFFLLLFFASFQCVLFSQEYNFICNAPEKAMTGSKYIAQAVNSSGDVFFIDGNAHEIQAFDNAGKSIESMRTFQTGNLAITLQNPKQLCFDEYDNLYIYDEGLGQIIKKPQKGNAFLFGEKGSSLGQIDDVRGLAVDARGYCYVLNGARKQIDIFDANGSYLTWISGTSVPFSDPISIGLNGASEVYVLEREGPTVFMFDISGNLVNTNRSLANRKNVLLTKPIGMAVLSNGDFLILDAASCQSTHFNRIGVVMGTIGSKGVSNKAVFQQASLISSSTSTNNLSIFDQGIQQAHVFKIVSPNISMRTNPKRLRMIETTTSRKPIADIAIAPCGYRYVIPADNKQKVIAYLDTTDKDVFTITGKIDEAVAIAADTANNLFVVDRGAKEVLMFDQKGTLIRKFGKEIENKLREPVSIVIQRSGNIVVADKSRGSLFMWNAQGIFKKIITSSENSVLKSPVQMHADSKDQLYVLDEDANCIYRIGSGGWPTAEKKLTARPVRPGEKAGLITGFIIDPLDNIILFNETTHQIEVYAWDFEPLLKFSIGKSGKDVNGLDGVEEILLDNETLKIYLTQNKGAAQKTYQFYLPPPIPEGQLTYDVVDGNLQVYFAKEKNASIKGYGLISPSKGDSLVYKSSTSSITIPPIPGDQEVHRYGFVSLNWSDHSEPSLYFDDYFTYAGQMASMHHYEEALGAYQLALEKFDRPQRMSLFIAKKVSDLSKELVQRNELSTALDYARYSFALHPSDVQIQQQYGAVLKANYLYLLANGEIATVIKDVGSLQSNASIKNLVLNTADSVCLLLSLEENLGSINNALALEKKLLEWDPTNYQYISTHAFTFLRLYRYQAYRNVSWLELKTILSEVSRYGQQGYLGLKQQKKTYFDTHLNWIEALNAAGSYSEAQKQTTAELGTAASVMSKETILHYRRELAAALTGLQQYSDAESEYTTILAQQPENNEVNLALAAIYIYEKKYDSAKSVYQKMMLGKTENALLTAKIGYVELLKGNYPEAIFQLEKSIKEAPAERIHYGYLAEAYHKTSNNPKALDNYEVAIEYFDDILTGSGHHNQSESSLKELRALREHYLFVVAGIQMENNDVWRAMDTYHRLTEINPQNGDAWYGLGNAFANIGLTYDALDAFNHAMAADENNAKYSNAYVNAVKTRDTSLQKEPPLNIVLLNIPDVYPSLYKNYADFHRLPVGELIIANNTSENITPISMTVHVKGLMSQSSEVKTQTIEGYSNERIKLSAVFPESILENNDKQSLVFEVVINYMLKGTQTTIQKSAPFILNGRNAIIWSDKRRLSAFVMPSAQQLIEYNKKSDHFFRDAPTFQMNKAIIKALQMYTLLGASGIAYSADPAQSYSRVSVHTDLIDYLQYPAETIQRKGGDCDDLVALMSALLENGGIAAAYIDIPGHVMMAFDCGLKPNDIAANGFNSRDVIINGDRVWIPIETTMIGKKNFMSAWKSGAERFYTELDAGNFPELIPFAEAWTIYTPSNYSPAGFTPEPPTAASVQEEYEVLLSQLFARTKKETISAMLIRYESEKDNSYVKNSYATLLARTGKMDEAKKIYEEALAISPENPTTLNNLGNIAYLNNQFVEAIGYYERASIADPEDANILINLCKANLGAGNKTVAKTWFVKATSKNSELEYLYDDLKPLLK